MTHLIQLIPTYGPSAGGVGTVVRNLNLGFQRRAEYRSEVYDLGKKPRYTDQDHLVSFGSGLADGLLGVYSGLLKAKPDITHLHGVWHPLSLPCSWAKPRLGHKHICSPHGMLAQWILSQNPSKKKIARLLYENAHWRRVDCFHALTQMEAEEIASVLPFEKPIAVIPNGIDMPSEMPVREGTPGGKPYILYLGRFHKKKGIEELLKAWELLGVGKDITLKIVGWGELECLQSSLPEGVEVHGPIDGAEKAALYREAEFAILPSFSEGLPMVILEAWSQGTPVIMTPYCNLAPAFEAGAAIEIEPEADSIRAGIQSALDGGPDLRASMAEVGFNFCKEHYSLDTIVGAFANLHRHLISGGNGDSIHFYV